MPYSSRNELPPAVKKLPKHAQDIWRKTFNAAYDEYDGDEEKAFAVAWAAVKKKYRKGEDGRWHRIEGKDMETIKEFLGVSDNPDRVAILDAVERFNDAAEKGAPGIPWGQLAEAGAWLARKAAEIIGGSWHYERGRVVGEMPERGLDAWAVGGPIKALDIADGETVRVGSYAVLWGGPDQRDLTGEYFTPNTAELERVFKALGKLPLIYRHAGDEVIKADVVGIVDFMARDDVGLWYEAQITAADEYKKAIVQMIQEGKLGTSSGTFPRARRVSREGEILRWPIIEVSATPMPAEPRLGVDYPLSVVKEHYEACGLTFDGVCGAEKEGEEPGAGIESTGTVTTPIDTITIPTETGTDIDLDAAKMWYRVTKELLRDIMEDDDGDDN